MAQNGHLACEVIVETREQSVREVDVRFKEQYCHGLVAKIDEHAVRDKLMVVNITRSLQIDQRSKDVDWVL